MPSKSGSGGYHGRLNQWRSSSSSGIHSLIACQGGSIGSRVSRSKGGGRGNVTNPLEGPWRRLSGSCQSGESEMKRLEPRRSTCRARVVCRYCRPARMGGFWLASTGRRPGFLSGCPHRWRVGRRGHRHPSARIRAILLAGAQLQTVNAVVGNLRLQP
jgi:hypothetical protein